MNLLMVAIEYSYDYATNLNYSSQKTGQKLLLETESTLKLTVFYGIIACSV